MFLGQIACVAVVSFPFPVFQAEIEQASEKAGERRSMPAEKWEGVDLCYCSRRYNNKAIFDLVIIVDLFGKEGNNKERRTRPNRLE